MWKFNNTLLNDDDYVGQVRQILTDCRLQFPHMEEMQFWDLLKFEASQISKNWSKRLAHNENGNKFRLYHKLGRMPEAITEGDSDNQLMLNLQSAQTELDKIETVEAKRAAFRCKKDWYHFGERLSSYFFNLEKCNYVTKTVHTASRKDGTLTKDNTEILDIQYQYYKELYTSDDKVKFSVINTTDWKLTSD